MAASREVEKRGIMEFQGAYSTIGGRIAPTNTPNSTKTHRAHHAANDGFNIWWQETTAQHRTVVAQASALIRIHRRVNSVNEACIGQTH
jgi:hypothetical protein